MNYTKRIILSLVIFYLACPFSISAQAQCCLEGKAELPSEKGYDFKSEQVTETEADIFYKPRSVIGPILMAHEKGGIRLISEPYDTIKEAPEEGFERHTKHLEVGQVYVVKDRTGQGFAKLKISAQDENSLSFEYAYNPTSGDFEKPKPKEPKKELVKKEILSPKPKSGPFITFKNFWKNIIFKLRDLLAFAWPRISIEQKITKPEPPLERSILGVTKVTKQLIDADQDGQIDDTVTITIDEETQTREVEIDIDSDGTIDKKRKVEVETYNRTSKVTITIDGFTLEAEGGRVDDESRGRLTMNGATFDIYFSYKKKEFSEYYFEEGLIVDVSKKEGILKIKIDQDGDGQADFSLTASDKNKDRSWTTDEFDISIDFDDDGQEDTKGEFQDQDGDGKLDSISYCKSWFLFFCTSRETLPDWKNKIIFSTIDFAGLIDP